MCARKIFDNKEQLIDENFEKDTNALYNIIKESKAYTEFKKLINKGLSLLETASLVLEQNRKDIKDKKRELSNNLINELKGNDLQALYDITHKNNIEYEYNKELLEKVLDEDTKEFFKQITKDELQDAVKWYKSSSSNRDLNMFFVFKNSIITNKVYKNNSLSFKTKELKQQKIIRDFFVRYDGKYYKRKDGANLNGNSIYDLIVNLNDNKIKTIDFNLLMINLYSIFNVKEDRDITGLKTDFNIEEAIQYYNKAKEEAKGYKKLIKLRLKDS